MTLSDHQDSEHFSYERSWSEIEDMLDQAERKMNMHLMMIQKHPHKKDSRNIFHMRNYKALQGVVKSLRWVLGDKDVEHPLE